MPIPFQHPSTILIAGPTKSGKTVFVRRLILEKMIEPYPGRIVIVYDEPQEEYTKIATAPARVEFVKGPISQELYNSFSSHETNLLVIDDQMASAPKTGGLISKFFTQGAHHRNLTVIYLVQNLFDQSKGMRTTKINSNYLVLYKNPADKAQSALIGRQMYPSKWRAFVPAFEKATAAPHSYMVIDLSPDTPDEARLRGNIFQSDENPGTDIYII